MSKNINKYEIFDIKQLAELEHKHRQLCKNALIQYKKWQIQHYLETDQVAQHYSQKQGEVLRQHAISMASYYWTIRQDFKAAFDHYIVTQCSRNYNNTYGRKAA